MDFKKYVVQIAITLVVIAIVFRVGAVKKIVAGE